MGVDALRGDGVPRQTRHRSGSGPAVERRLSVWKAACAAPAASFALQPAWSKRRTARSVWAERYDRKLEDVFAIQDEIAQSIAKALKVVLTEQEKRAIEKAPTADVQAYDYYLRDGNIFTNSAARVSTTPGKCLRAQL